MIQLYNQDCLEALRGMKDNEFDLVGYELDEDYFQAAKKRLEEHQQQLRLF